ncbi:C4-dicarboxylate transporter DctM subunit [Nitrobacteraceae bacterium AZCC 2161]
MIVGAAYLAATFAVLFAGVPIAFALGTVALIFLALFVPIATMGTVAHNVYQELANITLLTIPLFILKGAAIGRSRAGSDLYNAIYVWLNRVPGGLGIANVFACAIFAAMAGSSPATCSAIGSAGIPEMRRRGYSAELSAGIIAAGGTLGILLPPSVTMILYAVAAEQSLGRLFLAGIVPGAILSAFFAVYAVWRVRRERSQAAGRNESHAILNEERFSMSERFAAIPRVLPFLVLLTLVMVALYGGFATPSETAGLGAVVALLLIAVVYGTWRLADLRPILMGALSESTMLLMIVGMSMLYAMVMSYLHISQGAAEWIVAMKLPPSLLLGCVLGLVVVLGFFLPPASIILMTAPVVLPPLRAAGFDLIWFGVIMTIVMEMGLIHPPVGLNIFVINSIAPDITLKQIMWGTLPFVGIMAATVLLLCVFPGLITGLPNLIMK